MVGIDSNILLRLFLPEVAAVEGQSRQQAIAQTLLGDKSEFFFVNHVVIAETIWFLRQKLKYDKEIVAGIITTLLSMSNAVIQNADTVRLALANFKIYPGDFSDHLIAAVNRESGCSTTMTFDKAALKSPLFSQLQR